MTDSHPDERVALAPDLRSLSDRGARAWTEQMVVRRSGDEYVVDSESGGRYVVDPEAATCPDSRLRGERCKHRRRVAIEVTLGRVPPPRSRHGTCAACGETASVSQTPPSLCSACLLEPGDVVLDRETGDRLVVTGLREESAAEAVVSGTDTTVAEYSTNDGYPATDPVVEAVYLSSLPTASPTHYRFPLSRLDGTDDAAVLTAPEA